MNQYQQLSEKFSALESREKQLITWVSFALIIYLFFWFGVSPALDDLTCLQPIKQSSERRASTKHWSFKEMLFKKR